MLRVCIYMRNTCHSIMMYALILQNGKTASERDCNKRSVSAVRGNFIHKLPSLRFLYLAAIALLCMTQILIQMLRTKIAMI